MAKELCRAEVPTPSLPEGNERRPDLKGLDLRNADFSGSVLDGAVLRKVSMRGAFLHEVDFTGAIIRNVVLSETEVEGNKTSGAHLIISGLPYMIVLDKTSLRIGCEQHTYGEWASFDDDKIATMDVGSNRFWEIWGAPLLALGAGLSMHISDIEEKANESS